MENCGEELVDHSFLVRNQLTNYLLLVGLLNNPTRWKLMSALLIEHLVRQTAINATGYHIDDLIAAWLHSEKQ